MPFRPTCRAYSFALALAALCPMTEPASALDAVLAKRCRDMAIEAHPPKPAGSATGHAKAQRDFYNECIAKEGRMEVPANPDQKGATAPAQKNGDPNSATGAAR